MRNVLFKSLLCSCVLVLLTIVEAQAQRTMEGQNSSRTDLLWNGDSFGADVLLGGYTLSGYWETGITFNDYNSMLSTKDNLDYLHLYASGGYMFRLAGNTKRSIGLYGGSGAFAGVELTDYRYKLPFYIKTDIKHLGFLYGIYSQLLLEVFVSNVIALTINCSVAAIFSSPMGIFKYNIGVGCKIML